MDSPKKVMFIGHSFVCRLQRHFYGLHQYNIGLDTYCEALFLAKPGAHLTDLWRFANAVIAKKPNVLIIDIGTNDLCSYGYSPSLLTAEYRSFLNILIDMGIQKIVLIPVLYRSALARRSQ